MTNSIKLTFGSKTLGTVKVLCCRYKHEGEQESCYEARKRTIIAGAMATFNLKHGHKGAV